MINYTKGNLLTADVEALVNTVNTVGVMGKGIALMFKERFPKNMAEYALACKENRVTTGKMFITSTGELSGVKWIVNFPTKQHWRAKSKIEWIIDGLKDLRLFIEQNDIKSIAIPPLGAGNGGLDWNDVKPLIEKTLGDLQNTEIQVYEPTSKYQNIAKNTGVKKLTPARAMIAELIRRYWILGMECSLLEIQKLSWFLQRVIEVNNLKNELNLRFQAKNYGPYASNLGHLLNALDGSYLSSDKRIPDCDPLDVIAFNDPQKEYIQAYLASEGKIYLPAIEKASEIINGFESPFGMELLSTVDWLLSTGSSEPSLDSIKEGIKNWPAGERWAQRKLVIFNDESLSLALKHIISINFRYN
ncbi:MULTISPECIES: type II toxin-antitoxin system antitoxin DNA ADP-ribosyl glycohydrolase DarG [Alcaligenes]|jgi:O-acetyl-ADP-ribose deacetylase (regulator of RNase III)|uniref:type II toxin-antitoxin system antitoxin DNA ADP-ribosyl glycohydrolase DarG n=1 Tax=Alcaligenes TaxID=507 RepID=UPI001EF11258|nr:macro domain-containing protein [Alcaligenes faecalis]ULH07749.1 macro domain-containing protein [Alcaligenes faecalis]